MNKFTTCASFPRCKKRLYPTKTNGENKSFPSTNGRICQKCYKDAKYGRKVYPSSTNASFSQATSSQVSIYSLPCTLSLQSRSVIKPTLSSQITVSQTPASLDNECADNPVYTFIPQIKVAPKSHSRCFSCKKDSNLRTVNRSERYRILKLYKIFIPSSARLCDDHFLNDRISIKSIDQKRIECKLLQLDSQTSQEIIQYLLFSEFEPKPRSLGIENEFYEKIFTFLPDMQNRSSINLLLMKLKLGISDRDLADMTNIPEGSISRHISHGIDILDDYFVPNFLGPHHLTRNDLLKKMTKSASLLMDIHPPNILIIIDATYIYVQQFQNHKAMRKAYSVHKKTTLIKPTMIVTPTGYIIDVIPQHFTNGANNDSGILNSFIQNTDILQQILRTGDGIIVDRGYRDSRNVVEENGWKVSIYMMNIYSMPVQFFIPAFSPKTGQMSAEECNRSRRVTRCRWVVEVVNRVWRTYRLFGRRVDNHSIPNTDKLTKIVCALTNMSKNGIFKETEHHFRVSQQLHEKSCGPNINSFLNEILEKGLNTKWTRVDADEAYPNFPRLSIEDIQDYITLGPFAVKMAKRYIQEHFDAGSFTVFEHAIHKNVVRVQIHSRYRSTTKHNSWIEYIPTPAQDIHQHQNVLRYYCKCKAGARTAGCCCHVASIICYLGYYRYNKNDMSTDDCIFSHVEDTKRDIQQGNKKKPVSTTTIVSEESYSSEEEDTTEFDDELGELAFDSSDDETGEDAEYSEYTGIEMSNENQVNDGNGRDELLDLIDF